MRNRLKHDSIISNDVSLIQAMKQINLNKGRVLFLVDHKGHLKGSLSDGDIRRALLAESADLHSPASVAANTSPVVLRIGTLGIANLDFDSQFSIPVLDGQGRVVDIISTAGEMRIGRRLIDFDSPTFFIAEIGNNHNGDMELACKLVDKAIESGADAVKFQHRHLNEVYGSGQATNDVGVEYTQQLLSEVNLSPENMHELIKYAKIKGVLVGCTPFDLKSLADLVLFEVDFLKIASADMTNSILLEAAVKWFIPLIVSTGMSSLDEIERASKLMKRSMCPFALLHCNSTYPTPFKDVGLKFMPQLSEYSSSGVYGYSGHERGWQVPIAAIAMGASIIEKHFTIDRSMRGNDHKVSLLPAEFSAMVSAAKNVSESMGTATRSLSQGEMINRENLAKSIFSSRDVTVGEKLTMADFEFKSPGQGIQPDRVHDLVGKTLAKPVNKGDMIFYSHFQTSDDLDFKSAFSGLEFSRPAGIPVRFHDVEEMAANVDLMFVEFHLTNKDLSFNLQNFKLPSSIARLAVHAPELFDGDSLLDLANRDLSIREKSSRDMNKVVDVASRLGKIVGQPKVPIVVNVGGHTTGGFISPELRDELYDNVGNCFNNISTPSVDLLVQTMPPFPWHFGGQSFHNLFVDPEETLAFCQKWNVGICFDLSHSAMAAAWMDRNVIEWIEILGPWIRHLHLSDSAGVDGEGLQIGQGELDFQKISEALNAHAPNISFIPEIWQGHVDGGIASFEALLKLANHGLR